MQVFFNYCYLFTIYVKLSYRSNVANSYYFSNSKEGID